MSCSKGGMDKLDLYTEEELDKIDDDLTEDIMNLLADIYRMTRKELSQVFKGGI